MDKSNDIRVNARMNQGLYARTPRLYNLIRTTIARAIRLHKEHRTSKTYILARFE